MKEQPIIFFDTNCDYDEKFFCWKNKKQISEDKKIHFCIFKFDDENWMIKVRVVKAGPTPISLGLINQYGETLKIAEEKAWDKLLKFIETQPEPTEDLAFPS